MYGSHVKEPRPGACESREAWQQRLLTVNRVTVWRELDLTFAAPSLRAMLSLTTVRSKHFHDADWPWARHILSTWHTQVYAITTLWIRYYDHYAHFTDQDSAAKSHHWPEVTQLVLLVKDPPAVQEIPLWFLGREDPLEKGQATHSSILGLLSWLSWERICRQCRRLGFEPWVWKIPWRRKQLPTPVFWPGEFHRLCDPWGRKELDRTEQLSFSLHFRQLASGKARIPMPEAPEYNNYYFNLAFDIQRFKIPIIIRLWIIYSGWKHLILII